MNSGWTSRVSLTSNHHAEMDIVPTTDRIMQDCPRFRLLVVGRSGAGKAALINAVFGASFAGIHGQASITKHINEEIVSQHNKRLVIHYSDDYEPGNVEKFNILKKFITDRNHKKSVAERLHAIWLCIPTPSSGSRFTLDEKIFKIQNKVPIIVVFTKFDTFVSKLAEGPKTGKISHESAEKEFKERHGRVFETLIKNFVIPHTVVTTSQPETFRQLVQNTMQNILDGKSRPMTFIARVKKRLSRETHQPTRSDEKFPSPAPILLAAAQRVDMAVKIATSIKVARKTIVPDVHFSNVVLQKCLKAVHKDIVTTWNIQDPDGLLLSDTFCRRMTVLVDDLGLDDHGINWIISRNTTIASTAASAATVQTNGVHHTGKLPEHIRCLMGYVLDLILILQAVFKVLFREQAEQKLTPDHLNEILYEFICSGKKDMIHKAIAEFVRDHYPPASDDVVRKVESLIKQHEMKENDLKFNRTRPPLPTLLSILRVELPAQNAVNRITLDFMRELLNLPDYHHSISLDLETHSDVELFLDFTLCLLRDGGLANDDIPDATQRARRLMAKLSEKDVLPRSLFITDIKMDSVTIGMGGFGNVFKGEHKGQFVALKVIYRTAHQADSRQRVFCREAIAWRSLSHPLILPLLGVYEDKGWLYLVSPLMVNGTLSEWRRNQQRDTAEIHRLMQEVAEGVQFIHSEGIVHGDLHGGNILLDADSHCQITDFGLTRHAEATVARSTTTHLSYFAAPELFGTCTNCGQAECIGCSGNSLGEPRSKIQPHRSKTMQTDIYAFGCLYYAIFFDTVPFEGKNDFQITRLVTAGQRPNRLLNPGMEEDTWNLIWSCWRHIADDRPTIEDIVQSLVPPVQGQ